MRNYEGLELIAVVIEKRGLEIRIYLKKREDSNMAAIFLTGW